MGINFWFPEYQTPRFETHLSTVSAQWLLRLAHVDYDPDCTAGELSPGQLFDLVYNLEGYVLEHPQDVRHIYNVRYLVTFSRLLGFADSSGLSLKYG